MWYMYYKEIAALWYRQAQPSLTPAKRQGVEIALKKYIYPFLGNFEPSELTDDVFQECYAQMNFSQTYKERRQSSFTNYYTKLLNEICRFSEEKGVAHCRTQAPAAKSAMPNVVKIRIEQRFNSCYLNQARRCLS